MRDTSEAGLKARMKEHVERLSDWTLAKVAKATGDDYKNVLRWISGDTTVPADFVGRFIEKVPVDPRWLLTGEAPYAEGENGLGGMVRENKREADWERLAGQLDGDLAAVVRGEIRRLNSLQVPEWKRMLYRDSVGSFIGQAATLAEGLARREAERAAVLRAEIIKEANTARIEALRKAPAGWSDTDVDDILSDFTEPGEGGAEQEEG